VGRPTSCSKTTAVAELPIARTTPRSGSRCWHRFQSDRGVFLGRDYQRESVEATFKSIKQRLGETISSKDAVAQVNELLCKVLAHNIQVLIHESFEHAITVPRTTDSPPGPSAREAAPTPPVGHGVRGASPFSQGWTGEDN
jgi:hypothetical protein